MEATDNINKRLLYRKFNAKYSANLYKTHDLRPTKSCIFFSHERH